MAEEGSLVKPLGLGDLCVLQDELYITQNRWYNLGLQLGLMPDELDTIEAQCRGDMSDCFREVLKNYLQTTNPSWRAVIEALRSRTIDQPMLAKKLDQKYCPQPALKLFEAKDTPPPLCDESLLNPQESSMPLSSPVPEVIPETENELHTFATQISTSSALPTSDRHRPEDYGCGCGKCNFNRLFEKGCPKPILTMSSFPYLNAEGLDENQKQLLRGRLYRDFEMITTDFGNLVYKTCESLIPRISVRELVRLLMALGAFQPTLSERPLLRDYIEELQAADSIDGVFLILMSQGYVSFFSYHIIECIINAFGVQEDKENLRNYTAKFNEYSKRSIFECPAYSLARKDQANLVVKIEGVNFEQCNLSHLAAFKSRISDIIEVTEYTLRLCTVEKGCVQLTFQMPHFVKEVVFPLSDSQKAALRVEGVTRLTCEDYQCPLEISETDSTMSSTCAADQALEKLSDQLQPETKDTPAPLPAESLPNPQGSSMPLSPPCLVVMGVCV